ncbi:MAG TPA: hypothetical protein DDY92_00080 [Dialister sp.]|nr:hypothetical protein [Dialister sp.]
MNKVKYLSRLSEEDWIAMHKEVFGIEATDCEYEYDEDTGFYVIFWEKDGSVEHYHYYEYTRPQAMDSYFHNMDEITRRYFRYMAKKFGQEYINDFFVWKTDIYI